MESLKKVLLVDDDESCLFTTQGLLKRLKTAAVILLARNGQQALSLLESLIKQRQYPELILLELNVPVLDGYEFLEEIQKSADLRNAPLKIVLLSASATSLDLAKTKKYPVIDCMEKPLTPEKLAKILL